jgi:hypothetical protein
MPIEKIGMVQGVCVKPALFSADAKRSARSVQVIVELLRDLEHENASSAQPSSAPLEVRQRIHHMFEDVVHMNHVELSGKFDTLIG